jgi:hypothetical protein
MNGLNQISSTEIFERRDFNDIVFSDIETFVKLAAEYLKKPRWMFGKRRFSSDRKVMVGLVRNSDYALDNFRKLKYQGLWYRNGDIEAWKKPNKADKNGKYPTIIIARGIKAVAKLIEEDGY